MTKTRNRRLLRPPIVGAEFVTIPLTRGLVAVVDLVDVDICYRNWHAMDVGRGTVYAVGKQKGLRKHCWLHRLVAERMGLNILGKEVDHVDGDGLNCRRSNLRPATRLENVRNTS